MGEEQLSRAECRKALADTLAHPRPQHSRQHQLHFDVRLTLEPCGQIAVFERVGGRKTRRIDEDELFAGVFGQRLIERRNRVDEIKCQPGNACVSGQWLPTTDAQRVERKDLQRNTGAQAVADRQFNQRSRFSGSARPASNTTFLLPAASPAPRFGASRNRRSNSLAIAAFSHPSGGALAFPLLAPSRQGGDFPAGCAPIGFDHGGQFRSEVL